MCRYWLPRYWGDFVPLNEEIENCKDMVKRHNRYVAMKDEDCVTKLVEAIEPLIGLTGRSEKERLSYRDMDVIVSLYQSFYNASLKLLKRQVKSKEHILYHLMLKAGYEPFIVGLRVRSRRSSNIWVRITYR